MTPRVAGVPGPSAEWPVPSLGPAGPCDGGSGGEGAGQLGCGRGRGRARDSAAGSLASPGGA
jgi:hypothetical protein